MNNQEILNVFETKKELIINNTLNQIPNAMRGDLVNRSFYIDREGNVEYSIYLGQIQLDDTYFFNIHSHETLEPGDYDYENYENMVEDEMFIDDYYRDQIEEAIDNHILALEIYISA